MNADQSRRYEVVEVTIDGYNLYRYEDCNLWEKGFFTLIPKNKANYIMRLYVQDDHTSSVDATRSDRMKFIGIFKGFLVKNAPPRNLAASNSVVV